jgi:superfamily I DNA and/or RNA helicase
MQKIRTKLDRRDQRSQLQVDNLSKFVNEQLKEIQEIKRQLVTKDQELQELTLKMFAEPKPAADSQTIDDLVD